MSASYRNVVPDWQESSLWINDDGFIYQTSESTSTAGLDAALQVKVSTDGMHYVYKDLLERVYRVPVVYFDLKEDYGVVYYNLKHELFLRGDYSRNIDEEFIPGRVADFDAYQEITYYSKLIWAVLTGRMELYQLLNEGEKNLTLGSAVMAGAMETIGSTVILEAPEAKRVDKHIILPA